VIDRIPNLAVPEQPQAAGHCGTGVCDPCPERKGNKDAGQPTRNDHLGGTPLPRTHQDRHTTKRSRAAAHANDQLARRELRRGRLGYDALGNPRGAETTPSRSTLLMRRSLEPLLPGGASGPRSRRPVGCSRCARMSRRLGLEPGCIGHREGLRRAVKLSLIRQRQD